ncbi:unnamed protein product [Owenia fusiformis]|uniref:MYND-type domain-containing protein n=1 Tax=Owenia fusiformis TaxID=6347 RepID=A0A8S4PE24_OWEFU|nr:unnamed protein product [Owenia fusiformis]
MATRKPHFNGLDREIFFNISTTCFKKAISEGRLPCASDVRTNREKLLIEFLGPDGDLNGMGCDLRDIYKTLSELPVYPEGKDIIDMMESLMKSLNQPISEQAAEAQKEWDHLILTVRSDDWFNTTTRAEKKPVKYPIDGIPFLHFNLATKMGKKIKLQTDQDVIYYAKYGLSEQDAFHEARINLRKSTGFISNDHWDEEPRCHLNGRQAPVQKFGYTPHPGALLAFPTDISNMRRFNGPQVVMVPTIHKMYCTGAEEYEGCLTMGELCLKLYKEARQEDRVSLRPIRLVNDNDDPGEGVYRYVPYVPNMVNENCVPETETQVIAMKKSFNEWDKLPYRLQKDQHPLRFITTTSAKELGATKQALDSQARLTKGIASYELASYMMKKLCYQCGVTKESDGAKLSKCQGCRLAYYCGAECQQQNWSRHKKQCIALKRSLNKKGKNH